MELINPCGEFSHEVTPLAARPGLARGITIGLVNNSKKNADTVVEKVAELLAARDGGIEFARFSKEASQPADFTSGFLEQCDVVLAALAD